jgi:thiol-disulfide isomerase/thioredoxin
VGYKELPIEPKAAVYTFAFGVFLINALGLPQLECGGLLTAVCWLWHNRLEKTLLRDQAVLRDQALAKARAKALAEAREKKECDKNRKVTSIANKTEFDALLKASKVVIVDFYATWCPPCKIAAPEFAKVRGHLFHLSFLSCTRVLSRRPSLSLSLARALPSLLTLFPLCSLHVRQMSLEHPGVKFAKVDTDQAGDVSQAAGVKVSSACITSQRVPLGVEFAGSHTVFCALHHSCHVVTSLQAMPTFMMYVDGEVTESRTVQGWDPVKIEALLASAPSADAPKGD